MQERPHNIVNKASVNKNHVNSKSTQNLKKEGLKVLYTNADNSLASKLDELHIHITASKPDIICITEAKPKNGSLPSNSILNMTGYTLLCSDFEKPDTRGVCVYIKNDLSASEYTDNITSKYNDSIWLTVDTPRNKKILIGTMYRSGTHQTAAVYDNNLHEVINHTSELKAFTQTLIMGDFNHGGITWADKTVLEIENPKDKVFADCIQDCYLFQHVTAPTRYRHGQNPKILDLILTTEENLVEHLTMEASLGKSDHAVLTFTVHTGEEASSQPRTTFMYDIADYEAMKNSLMLDWELEFKNLTAEQSMTKLEQKIKEAMKTYIPTKTYKSNEGKIKAIWMDSYALGKVKKKHHAFIRYMNTLDGKAYQTYIRARNHANKAIRRAKKDFEKKLAKESKINKKGIWKYINSKTKSKSGINNLLKEDGTLTIDDQEKAERLSSQYKDTFTTEDLTNIPDFKQKSLLTDPLLHITITRDQVNKKLKKLRVDKSPGIDGLHPRILKELADVIDSPLATIFQQSMDEGKLPSIWKHAQITPIYKKGPRNQAKNYRPISLTSIVCKLMETIICEIIIEHVKTNKLGSTEQHGFSKGKSTVTNLLEALNIWTEAAQHGIPTDVIYLDYAKAFDTVPHERLIRQISTFGINGLVLEWIRSFLTGRKQQVRVNNSTSSWEPVSSGVPQGSVMGPILFTLFVNDCPSAITNHISLYADDTKLFSSKEDADLQTDLDHLQQWANDMQMQFHPDKCKVLHLGIKNKNKAYTMKKPDGSTHTLATTSEEKDVGVIVDDKLSFNAHIANCINKGNRMLGILRRTFTHMDKTIFLPIYKCMVRPHLEYATCVWSPTAIGLRDKLESVQRRATKLIPELKNLEYADRLKALQLPSLCYRRRRADIIETYKIIQDLDHINMKTYCTHCQNKYMFQKTSVTTNRGHNYKLQVQHATGIRAKYFSTRVTPNWNNLSAEIVNAVSINHLKNALLRDHHEKKLLYTIF